MKIAVQGCCHGALDAIYSHIQTLESRHAYNIDVLLICGDFQAVRNHADLQCMAVPQKYRQLGDFWRYYTGQKTAPILTIVIGGNHEASNYFWELYHGGWLAPNIYFLGHAGCVQVNGLRIAGASGIYKGHDFRLGHYERLPYDHGSMRSIYHIREYNVRRLSLLSSPHIFLSHDWPCTIEKYGNLPGLLRRKPFFRSDIENGRLGSPPLMGLLMTLRPRWWFAAHLHVRFEGVVKHESGEHEESCQEQSNPDEIAIDFDENEPASIPAPGLAQNPDEIILDDELDPPAPAPLLHVAPVVEKTCTHKHQSETRFLALDKCLPRRDFLEVIDIPAPLDSPPTQSTTSGRSQPNLTYDPEWLAITRAFAQYFSGTRVQTPFPDEEIARKRVQEEVEWVRTQLSRGHPDTGVESSSRSSIGPSIRAAGETELDGLDIRKRQTFVQTAPGVKGEGTSGKNEGQPPAYTNPQTVEFCKMLEIEDQINPLP